MLATAVRALLVAKVTRNIYGPSGRPEEKVNGLIGQRKWQQRAGLEQLQKHDRLGILLAGPDERDTHQHRERADLQKRSFTITLLETFPSFHSSGFAG